MKFNLVKGWLAMTTCRKSSITECVNCEDYQCKNLWGPIKQNSRCYKMIENKLFDECVFGCENENDLNGCARCQHLNECSTLVRQNVALMD